MDELIKHQNFLSRFGLQNSLQMQTNGTLASIAVGFFMKLATPWETQKATPLLLEYDGDLQTVTPSNKLAYLPAHCKHFVSLDELGDPFWTPDALAAVQLATEDTISMEQMDGGSIGS